MKLVSLSVENFRAIREVVEVNLEKHDIVFLFGPNNSGKSSVLAVYEFLFGKTVFEEDFHDRNKDQPINITARFRAEQEDEAYLEKNGLMIAAVCATRIMGNTLDR